MVLNTAVAEALRQFYEKLKDTPADQMDQAVHELVKRAISKHKRVIFNGNGYTDDWVQEAKKRGLYNLASTPEALAHFTDQKNIDLFTRHHIFTEQEIFSRYCILLESYNKTVHLEAKTLQSMVRQEFLPALLRYQCEVANCIISQKEACPTLACPAQSTLLEQLAAAYQQLTQCTDTLCKDLAQAEQISEDMPAARFYHDTILPDMLAVRHSADAIEPDLPEGLLGYPNYEALLFSV